jgi:hypothetical protein
MAQDFSTTAFETLYNKATKEGRKLKQEATFRRYTAYFLKGIAVLSGIALATGLPKGTAQILGVVVAVVIAVDELFANYKRLTVMTTASYAYENLFDKIQYAYNFQLQADVVSVRDSPASDEGAKEINHQKAYQALVNLNQTFSTLIYETTSKLKQKIQESDLAFLSSVAQDKNKQHIDITKE